MGFLEAEIKVRNVPRRGQTFSSCNQAMETASPFYYSLFLFDIQMPRSPYCPLDGMFALLVSSSHPDSPNSESQLSVPSAVVNANLVHVGHTSTVACVLLPVLEVFRFVKLSPIHGPLVVLQLWITMLELSELLSAVCGTGEIMLHASSSKTPCIAHGILITVIMAEACFMYHLSHEITWNAMFFFNSNGSCNLHRFMGGMQAGNRTCAAYVLSERSPRYASTSQAYRMPRIYASVLVPTKICRFLAKDIGEKKNKDAYANTSPSSARLKPFLVFAFEALVCSILEKDGPSFI